MDDKGGLRENKVTFARIAETLGVSRSTVSNAYNRPDQLSEALREKILRTAAEMGYAGPDPAARALSRRRSGVVGMVFTEELSFAFSDPAAVSVLQGLSHACREAGVGLLLLPVAQGREEDADSVRDASIDGLVVYSMPDEDPTVKAALQRHLTTVFIDQPRVEGEHFVGIDDRLAAREATRHLLALGHESIGYIAYRLGPDLFDGPVSPERLENSGYRLTRERFAGYEEALQEAGLGWESIRIEERSAMTPSAGYDATRALLDSDAAPTALVTDSDQLAFGALRAASEEGIAVPEQLSVVGLDDIPAAEASIPALTTIRQPLYDKGLAAGRRLFESGSEGEQPSEALLPIELVIRGSTATAPGLHTRTSPEDDFRRTS